ncbi:MAG: helix-turn-helix domain-containing protein [Nanoarchaeota archaeon]
MDLTILEDLGLTRAETKIYVTLLELGSSTAGPILNKCGLQNSVVHRALNALIEKGLINFVLEGKVKVYQATNPDNFIDFIDEKKKKFEEILPDLKKKQDMQKKQENATIYKGKRGIKEVYYFMINQRAKEYLTFGGGPPCVETMGLTWWINLHKKRVAKKLPSRQIFDLLVRKQADDIESQKITDIRYLSKEFAQFQETVIVGEYVAVNVFTENPYSFLIKDKAVAEGYRKYFEVLWKIAKK